MFPLPKKLSSSFGLLGDDAKLAFRTQPNGIAKLAEKRDISETDDVYWSQYVILFDSASDVFTLITPQDIRRALSEAPENVATLIRVICHRLFNLATDHTFPSPVSQSPISISKLTPWASPPRNPTKEALNCVRVLSRVLPVLFESEGPLERDVFWTRPKARTEEEGALEEPQFVIEEEDEEEFGYQSPRASRVNAESAEPTNTKAKDTLPSLAERLFSTIIDLLFCCGFTLPMKIQVEHHKINYVIWDKGIGSGADIGSTAQLDSNKTEVLRLLLVLLSKTIYHPPTQLLTLTNPYASHLVHATPRRLVLSLLCSLLNTAMNGGETEGWSGALDRVPYNHLILVRKGEEGRSGLVGLCLGVLCVLLDYQADEARDPGETGSMTGDGATAPTSHSNAFRYFIAKLHRPADFAFILNGILGILEQHMATSNNLLPGSRRPVPYILETFVFLWKMIELNKRFRAYILDSEKLLDTLAYLLCFCLEHKDKPQQHGLCRALSYIIQSLSAERAFGACLSTPMPLRIAIPTKWAALGTAGDFLVSSIYAVIATTSGTLNSLYPALIIALSNAAPYLKNLTIKSSTKLIQLFAAFSNPVFLLADEGHPRLLFSTLEVFNGILYHQLQNNPNVLYAILRSHRIFEELGTFTLSKGLREIRRIQLAKESKGKDVKTDAEDTSVPEKTALLANPEDDDEEAEEPEHGAREDGDADTTSSAPDTPDRDSLGSPRVSSPDGTPLNRAKISEKARGKMRERRSGSLSLEVLDPELERIAAAGVGRNGFVPTQEWVASWQQGLPLDPILLAISELLPKVSEMQSSLNRQTTSPVVLDFLRSVTLQHVLPPAPPVVARRFQWSDASLVWLSSLIWGELYVRGTTPLGIWNSTNVRLFGVRHTPQPRGVGETVQNVVGGLWNPGSPPPNARVLPRRMNSGR